jgi:hypothetical protein
LTLSKRLINLNFLLLLFQVPVVWHLPLTLILGGLLLWLVTGLDRNWHLNLLALWWDERFIEILLLNAFILIASELVTLNSTRRLSHLNWLLKLTAAIISYATSASTVVVFATATAPSLGIMINTYVTIIRNLTLMHAELHEISLVQLWLLSLNLTSWGVIVLEASLIWHLLSFHLISLVFEAS